MLEFSVWIYRIVCVGVFCLIIYLYASKFARIIEKKPEHGEKDDRLKQAAWLAFAPPLVLWLGKIKKETREKKPITQRELWMWAAFGCLIVGLTVYIVPNTYHAYKIAVPQLGKLSELCAMKKDASLKELLTEKPRSEMTEYSNAYNMEIRTIKQINDDLTHGYVVRAMHAMDTYKAQHPHLSYPQLQFAYEDVIGLQRGSFMRYLQALNISKQIEFYNHFGKLKINIWNETSAQKLEQNGIKQVLDSNRDGKIDTDDLKIIEANLNQLNASQSLLVRWLIKYRINSYQDDYIDAHGEYVKGSLCQNKKQTETIFKTIQPTLRIAD